MKKISPESRFSNRVEDYVKYRPSYPPSALDFLKELGLKSSSIVADVGSGTGIFSRLLLENGNQVYGVEPNEKMRQAAESYLKSFQNFKSIGAPAEATTLSDSSVDFITVAQAFHWFKAEIVREEFKRILKPEGWVFLIWNRRKMDQVGFSADYENLLKEFAIDYPEVKHSNLEEKGGLDIFFGKDKYKKWNSPNHQSLDFDGLKGRLLSSSYMPKEDGPRFDKMITSLKDLFARYQKKGRVRFEYATDAFYGKLK